MECVMVCMSQIHTVTFRPYGPTLPMWKRDSVLTLERDSLPSGLRTGLEKKKGSLEGVVSPYRYKGRNLLGGVVCDARYAFFHACP